MPTLPGYYPTFRPSLAITQRDDFRDVASTHEADPFRIKVMGPSMAKSGYISGYHVTVPDEPDLIGCSIRITPLGMDTVFEVRFFYAAPDWGTLPLSAFSELIRLLKASADELNRAADAVLGEV